MEFTVTKLEYEQFYFRYHKYKLKKSITVIVILSVFFGIVYCDSSYNWIKMIGVTSICLIFFISILFVLPYLQSLSRISSAIKANPGFLDCCKLSITDDGLQIESSAEVFHVPWMQIVSIDTFNQYVILYFKSRIELLIPSRAFNSKNEVKNFVDTIRIEVSKSKILSTYSLTEKPNYKQGYFCLIPIIGFFLGIMFVILGIFKFKDKWLILIGLLGIMFTPILYDALFPEFWNKGLRDEKNIELVKGNMNNLIKDIEFYKIQHGAYPISLDKIDYPLINDIFQSDKKGSTPYNYRVIGDKYMLFSSGVDRLPNTVDDIYPDIATDESEIGLIRESNDSINLFQNLRKVLLKSL